MFASSKEKKTLRKSLFASVLIKTSANIRPEKPNNWIFRTFHSRFWFEFVSLAIISCRCARISSLATPLPLVAVSIISTSTSHRTPMHTAISVVATKLFVLSHLYWCFRLSHPQIQRHIDSHCFWHRSYRTAPQHSGDEQLRRRRQDQKMMNNHRTAATAVHVHLENKNKLFKRRKKW